MGKAAELAVASLPDMDRVAAMRDAWSRRFSRGSTILS